MSVAKIEKSIEELLIENKEIKYKLDILMERINESLCTTRDLELVAAKIIKEVKEETNIVSEKVDLTAFPLHGKYSYPNYEVGNKELGSSGNPKAVSWPTGQIKPIEKIKLIES